METELDREIFIYGTQTQAYWVTYYLEKCGYSVAGYIDQSAGDWDDCCYLPNGLPILHPKKLAGLKHPIKIIITIVNIQSVIYSLHRYLEDVDILCLLPLDSFDRYNINRMLSFFRFSLLKNKPTILSNRCDASYINEALGVQHLQPTFNTLILPDDFLKLCKAPKDYLELDMTFAFYSIRWHQRVPVGKVGDIHVEFAHPKSEDGSRDIKLWNRMRKFVNYDNLAFVFQVGEDPQFCASTSIIKEYLNLPQKHILITNNGIYIDGARETALSNQVNVRPFGVNENQEAVESFFDLLGWINGDCGDAINSV